LRAISADPLARAEEVTQHAFRASLLTYIEEKTAAAIANGDVAEWIDDNAGRIAPANLEWPGNYLIGGTDEPDKCPRLHDLLDVSVCTHRQNRVLRVIWADIETAIAELLAADLGDTKP
jgi:hypothetical protein